jgi:hypothetical protein
MTLNPRQLWEALARRLLPVDESAAAEWTRYWAMPTAIALLYSVFVPEWSLREWPEFLPIGLMACLATAWLSIRFPLSEGIVWRAPLFGTICIWLPFLVPDFYRLVVSPVLQPLKVLFHWIPDQIQRPSPWAYEHKMTNALTGLTLTVVNLAIALLLPLLRRRPKTRTPVWKTKTPTDTNS